MKKIISFLFIFTVFFPTIAFARVTPSDIHKDKVEVFEAILAKIPDANKRAQVEKADQMLYDINQLICSKFDGEVAKLTGILEELKSRAGVNETVVAYGQGDTPLDSAAYWVNWAQEAVAYQKIADYTPLISATNFINPLISEQAQLKADLRGLAGKIIKAKGEVAKAIK